MSNLESVVPPLEDCQKIPAGEFADSALVWVSLKCEPELYEHVESRHDLPHEDETDKGKYSDSFEIITAPTPAEILAKLPFGTILMLDATEVWVCIVHLGQSGVMIEKNSNPATAALRLLLKLKGIEVKE
jgi:hypothetical protein